MSRPVATLLLLICTMLWGFAFIAQKSGMGTMGPLTFAGVRYLLGGLLRQTTGDITIAGKNLKSLSDNDLAVFRSTHLGFVFQQFHLLPRASVLDNIMLPLPLFHVYANVGGQPTCGGHSRSGGSGRTGRTGS